MTFTHEWTVRFSDADPFEIAHYPRIVDAFQETADAYVESLGYPFWGIQDDLGIGLPVVAVDAEFTGMLHPGETVAIELVPELGTTSVRFDYTGRVAGEERFSGSERRVSVDTETRESTPIPEDLRAAIEG